MSSSEVSAMALARRGVRPAQPAASLAGLIDVLDRADGAVPTPRTRPVHTSAFRASVRAVPLRSMQQAAPSVRPARLPAAPTRTPTVTVVPDPERRPLTGLRDLTRRVALWGGGAHGEYLAWRTPEPPRSTPLRPRLRALTRRIALWGAGPNGEHLAWGRPTPVPAPRQVDPPVVLRELPSTPTIRPAAPSPAVALLPAPTGPVLPGWAPPPSGWPQPPAWRTSAPVRAASTRPAAVAAPARSGPRRTVPAARSPSSEARAGPARSGGDPSSRSVPRPALPAPG